MHSEFIKIDNHVAHYYVMGTGSKVLLAFHGFGLDGKSFAPLTPELSKTYTLYSFDLFYHGKSHWGNNDLPLTKAFWKQFIQQFTTHIGASRFSLLCFSLGGKFALSCIEGLADRIDRVIFIAPDGIQTSMWYNLATYPIIFKGYFRRMIVRPGLFYNMLDLLKKAGFVSKSISKFAASQMNTVKKRRRVYYAWVIFKQLSFDLVKIATTINHNEISVIMVLGQYDQIITERGMKRLLNKLNHYELEIVNSGHNDLIRELAKNPDLLAQF